MLACHLFVFFLLVLDWVEDPHFGQCPYSGPFTSRLYHADDSETRASFVVPVTPVDFTPITLTSRDGFAAVPARALMDEPARMSSLYQFMSLQR